MTFRKSVFGTATMAMTMMQSFTLRPSPSLRTSLSCKPSSLSSRSFQQQSMKFSSTIITTSAAAPTIQPSSSSSVKDKSDAGSRLFVGHTIYKGKAAFTFSPGKPVFRTNENGNIFLEKPGALFLEFASATAQRQYDWNNKQVMALSVCELGTLLALTANESLEFFHDPHMQSSNAGMVRKTLKMEPMQDKTGFFLSLNVTDKIEDVDERFLLPITKGELAMMKSAINYIIPYLMGWHAYVNPSLVTPSTEGKLESLVSKISPEVEWSK